MLHKIHHLCCAYIFCHCTLNTPFILHPVQNNTISSTQDGCLVEFCLKMYWFIFTCQWYNLTLAAWWSEVSEGAGCLWQRLDPAQRPIEGNNKTCLRRPLKSNANVRQKQALKSSVRPDSRCGCSRPSDLSLPEMDTDTFLERTQSVQATATGLRHPSGLCQSNFFNCSQRVSDNC